MNLPKLNADQILDIISNNMTEKQFALFVDIDWIEQDSPHWNEESEDKWSKITIPETEEFTLLRQQLEVDKTYFEKKIKELSKTPQSQRENEVKLKEFRAKFSSVSNVDNVLKLYALGLGQMIEVHQEGGSGRGEIWYSVKYFPSHDVYIKIEGWYSSYEGTNFDYGYGSEVFPRKKEIIVYDLK